ncbi:MAG TPA: hypothetical protein VFM18_18260 [Methanosarcina sp.]|nr:hypothetical protein [Methanosarcina sp.]
MALIKQENGFGSGIGYKPPQGWSRHTIINTMGFTLYEQIYQDVILWIYNNIDECENNAHWFRVNDCIYVYLKKSEDTMLFTLRWSAVD